MNIKVLGTGCANCKTTLNLISAAAAAKGITIELEKVEDIQAIMEYNVMSTPAVVVDGMVVHSGGIPAKAAVEGWLVGGQQVSSGESGGCCGAK